MEKKDLLEVIDDVRSDIKKGQITEMVIAVKTKDGDGVAVCASEVVALGLAETLKIKTKQDYEDHVKANNIQDFLESFLEDDD